MDPEIAAHLDAIRALLVFIVAACVAYFLIPPTDAELTRDHDLGYHKGDGRFGCPSCKRERS